jgi:hypothetical protein
VELLHKRATDHPDIRIGMDSWRQSAETVPDMLHDG